MVFHLLKLDLDFHQQNPWELSQHCPYMMFCSHFDNLNKLRIHFVHADVLSNIVVVQESSQLHHKYILFVLINV